MGDADRAWAEMLAQWAIPDELVQAVPESPYFFDPTVFIAAADRALLRADDTPSDRVAREALGDGTVLDVASGAGAASLRLGPSHLTAVDLSVDLLDALAERARGLGVPSTTIVGRWPEEAETVEAADVVVCHHVFYNVPELASFAAALTSHARHRVVVELTAEHPMRWLEPYWQALHGLTQPAGPTVDDAIAVLTEMGLMVQRESWRRDIQMIGEHSDDAVERIARRLCLPPSRLPELRAVLEEVPPPTAREVVTLWW